LARSRIGSWCRRAPFIFAALALLLAACNPFRPAPRTPQSGLLPETYSIGDGLEMPQARWWEDFREPELNALVAAGLDANLTLSQAWARLDQARAVAVQAGAARYPDLTGFGEAGRSYRHSGGTSLLRDGNADYTLGLMSRYEIDLWGKVASGREAAVLQSAAAREELQAAAVTVAAEVTRLWAGVISERMQLRLLEQQLEGNRIYLELVELRFRMALGTALDVFQQRQVVERVQAEIPLVEERRQLLLHQLALLLGLPPQKAPDINRSTLPSPSALPAAGLPADLLELRPDVKAAQLRLEAADWQVAAARADRLPSINLSADLRLSAESADQLWDSWFLNLAAGLTAPLLDGRRRAAEVERTRAVVEENLSRYRETVLTAVKEVEDALVTEDSLRRHITAIERELQAGRSALEEAIERYRKGLNDYLPVLTQLVLVQGLERDLVRRSAELLTARIGLYRALGGRWIETM